MFTVEGIKSQIVNHLFNVWYSSAIYRAPKSARDGSGYAVKRKPYFLFRRRGLAAQETTAPDLQKPAFRKPHLSGQPGRRHVSAGRREGAPSSRSACRCGEAATNVCGGAPKKLPVHT